MNAEFFSAIADIEKEKGIPRQYMLDKIELALLAALKKDNPAAADCARVTVDEAKKKIDMYIQKTVVETVENPATELSLEEAVKVSPKAELGDIINEPLETKKFGRIAAQAAKQVIIRGSAKLNAAYYMTSLPRKSTRF
jgi:N utilization substance protein A